MLKHRIRAVVLDLFDTLVKWDPERLPTIDYQGRKVRSTIPWLTQKLEASMNGGFDLRAWMDAYHDVTAEIAEERERDAIEVTCHERFLRTLRRFSLLPQIDAETLAEELTRSHMAGIRAVTYTPPENSALVRQLVPRYRLGLLSNFDDSRTGREIVSDTGVGDLFEAVVISADVALRKPNVAIFQRMLEMLKIAPQEMLFVGDTPREDLVGARNAGIPVVWISNGKGPLPDGIPAPDHTITKLPELADLLDL